VPELRRYGRVLFVLGVVLIVAGAILVIAGRGPGVVLAIVGFVIVVAGYVGDQMRRRPVATRAAGEQVGGADPPEEPPAH
jgi:hypothetical protein